jgi:hypothetical protein
MPPTTKRKPPRTEAQRAGESAHTLEFRAEARRQSRAIAASAHAAEDQGFIDAVSDRSDA